MVDEGVDGKLISDKNNNITRIVEFKILKETCFLVRDTVSSVQRNRNIITVEDSLRIECFINPTIIVHCGKRGISFALERYQISIQSTDTKVMNSVFQR